MNRLCRDAVGNLCLSTKTWQQPIMTCPQNSIILYQLPMSRTDGLAPLSIPKTPWPSPNHHEPHLPPPFSDPAVTSRSVPTGQLTPLASLHVQNQCRNDGEKKNLLQSPLLSSVTSLDKPAKSSVYAPNLGGCKTNVLRTLDANAVCVLHSSESKFPGFNATLTTPWCLNRLAISTACR